MIERVRKEKEMELKKKEIDAKVKEKIDKELVEKTVEIVKKQREFATMNMTADANGNPIKIKGLANVNLQADFLNIRDAIKDKGEIINTNHILQNAMLSTSVESPKKPEKESKAKDKESEKKSSFISPGKRNQNNPIPMSKGGQVLATGATVTSTTPEPLHLRGPILPAGSSYDLMSPEVGVTILEGAKIKTGGKDFYKVYNKHSKYDYMTMLKDTVISNHTSSMKENAAINMDYSTLLEMNNSGKDSVLPHLKLSGKITDPNKSIKSQYSLNGSIKVNNKFGVSLKNALDGLDLIPEYEENISLDNPDDPDEDVNNSNIFKKTKKDTNEEYGRSMEEINKFTYSIIKNSGWGNNTSSKLPKDQFISSMKDKGPHKPDQREIEMEVGKNITKTKLPRSRVYSYIKNPNNPMNNTTTGFGAAAKKKIPTNTQTDFNKTNTQAAVVKNMNKTFGTEMAKK